MPTSATPTFEVDRQGIGWIVFDDPDRKLNVLTEPVMARLADALEEAERAARRRARTRGGLPQRQAGLLHRGRGRGRHRRRGGSRGSRAEGPRRPGDLHGRGGAARCPRWRPSTASAWGAAPSWRWRAGTGCCRTPGRRAWGSPRCSSGSCPAWGGTTRLPRLVGLQAALDLLLTGRLIDSRKAAASASPATVVPAELFLEQVTAFALRAPSLPPGTSRPNRGLMTRLLDGTAPAASSRPGRGAQARASADRRALPRPVRHPGRPARTPRAAPSPQASTRRPRPPPSSSWAR